MPLKEGGAPALDNPLPEGEEEGEEGEEAPSKIVARDAMVELRAAVMVLDFGGRSDAKSLTTILGNVAPRHLILVHGTARVCCRCCTQPMAGCWKVAGSGSSCAKPCPVHHSKCP